MREGRCFGVEVCVERCAGDGRAVLVGHGINQNIPSALGISELRVEGVLAVL